MTLLELRAVGKEFLSGSEVLHVLRDVSLAVRAGETVAITGPSGSGKSTLLGIMAGLDQPTSGGVLVRGEPAGGWDEDRRAAWRRRSVGFVFQNARLVPSLTAVENAALPLELGGMTAGEAATRAADILAGLGLGERLRHFPRQLSGGEQQRVAIARAFAHQPEIIFADEPTGSVDREHAANVLDTLLKIRDEAGTALVLVTHDPAVAGRMARTLRLSQGSLAQDPQSIS